MNNVAVLRPNTPACTLGRAPGFDRRASLRSEHPEQAPWKCRPLESAENSKDEFPTLSTGLGNPAPNAGFPHFHRAGGGFTSTGKDKNETKIRFQLTDRGQFKHDKNASVASLRS
jgi:hypothetical protein